MISILRRSSAWAESHSEDTVLVLARGGEKRKRGDKDATKIAREKDATKIARDKDATKIARGKELLVANKRTQSCCVCKLKRPRKKT